MAGCQGQPEVIVGTLRTHTAAQRADATNAGHLLPEIGVLRKEAVLARKARFGMNKRHDILQLIAEAEGAARLVVSGSRP